MAKFIETVGGIMISANAIRRTFHRKNQWGVTRDWIELDDGEQLELLGDAINALGQYLPNHNHDLELWRIWSGIEEQWPGDNLAFEILPITSWRVDCDGSTAPVTCEEQASSALAELIHDRSRNTWIDRGDRIYTTAESMLEALYELAAVRRNRHLEKQCANRE